jgi:hypothetical protein
MKHMSWMLVLALLAVSPAFAVRPPWQPLESELGCPDTDNEEGDPRNWIREDMTALPTIAKSEFNLTPWEAATVTWPDVVTNPYNFCGIFDSLYCQVGPIAGALDADDITEFADLIMCLTADINGPVDFDAEIPVTPNGMLDSYELAVVAAILNDPDSPLHEEVTASFQGFFVALKNLVMPGLADVKGQDYRSIVTLAAPHLPSGLISLLCGFAVLGDPDTDEALDGLMGLLSDIGIEPPDGGIGALGAAVPALAPDGDADGDGFTNRQEYDYFVKKLEYSPEEYAAAVLNADDVPDVPKITITGPEGRVVLGDNVTLSATVSFGEMIDFAWDFNGFPLDDEVGSSLTIPNVQLEDSGRYTAFVTVDDGAKAIDVYDGYYDLVVSEFGMPVGSALGLSIFAGACALAGAMGIRRRK